MSKIKLGPTEGIHRSTGPRRLAGLFTFLAKMSPAAAAEFVARELEHYPDLFSHSLGPDAISGIEPSLVMEIDRRLPEGYSFGLGIDWATGTNEREYGIWPDEGLLGPVDELVGVLTFPEKNAATVEVLLHAHHQIVVEARGKTDLYAIDNAIGELIRFGFRGKLRVLWTRHGPQVFEVDAGAIAGDRLAGRWRGTP